MTSAESNLSDEAVLQSAAQHFTARDLDRRHIELVCDDLLEHAHTADDLADRNDLDLVVQRHFGSV